MSFIEIQCSEVLSSVIFIIEDELETVPQAAQINSHLTHCAPCTAEIEHERLMHQMLADVLKRSGNEQAPEELRQNINRQIREQLGNYAGATEVVTQFSMTEISIEVDEFGNIEHREIQIEQTHIQHFIDDED